jgi:leucyl aminopeptidase (aminopeptidase T)
MCISSLHFAIVIKSGNHIIFQNTLYCEEIDCVLHFTFCSIMREAGVAQSVL